MKIDWRFLNPERGEWYLPAALLLTSSKNNDHSRDNRRSKPSAYANDSTVRALFKLNLREIAIFHPMPLKFVFEFESVCVRDVPVRNVSAVSHACNLLSLQFTRLRGEWISPSRVFVFNEFSMHRTMSFIRSGPRQWPRIYSWAFINS